MNRIQAVNKRSKYSNEPHLTINVDGKSLDIILNQLFPEKSLIGFVPTLLDWLDNKEERKLVWDRVESSDKQIVPILMCPDDLDLWCTVVNVEIEKTEKSVKWLRLGIDTNKKLDNMPNSIGSKVDWFTDIGPFEFDRIEYEKFISVFKSEIEIDEIKKLIHSWITRIDEIEKIPDSIIAFNFGIVETEDGYHVYLIGVSDYDVEDDDWACEEDFIPEEKYLDLGAVSSNWDWEEVQSIVKDSVEQYIRTSASPKSFVHKAEYLTTGFDDGELERIEK
jgi:predicted transcriptional regulator YdeE